MHAAMPAVIKLDPPQEVVLGRGLATCPDFKQVCAPAEPKGRPITWKNFVIDKTPKSYKMT